jgi:hypothetical protein
MNNELERIEMKAIMSLLKTLFHICLVGLRKSAIPSTGIVGLQADILTREFQNMKQQCQPLNRNFWYAAY